MKTTTILLSALFMSVSAMAQTSAWQPAGNRIKTPWAEQVNPQCPLPEYPRPLLVRPDWENLNGMWQYAITSATSLQPSAFDGQILVPYPLESSLSGVMRTMGQSQVLWYQRDITLPASWQGQHILLHFGAVDFEAQVYVNGQLATTHQGGFTSFSADITQFLHQGRNTLTVRVSDPTDERLQPLGKQRRDPGGPGSIWYTSVSGIWQTVWMEPVPATHITDLRTTPDLDHSSFIFEVKTSGNQAMTDRLIITLTDGGHVVQTATGTAGTPLVLNIKKPTLWTPDTPHLYQVTASIVSADGSIVDKVSSYAAMRKISVAQNPSDGVWRLQLNNRDYFHFGPLDQGYWPDGLYTAPTDEALRFDIEKTKEWGFNMIRKHMKVEPARWYYYCDSIGLLVWQDMPSVGRSDERWEPGLWRNQSDGTQPESVENHFRQEWSDIINQHYSYPSIVVWTPFNEAWGQFKTADIVALTRRLDSTRLINPASGGNHYHTGDFIDLHDYARPPHIFINDTTRPVVLGEYGGLGRHIEGHRWYEQDATTYVNYKDAKELTDSYMEQSRAVLDMARGITLAGGTRAAFSAAVYTQTTDVETEVNGLMTYDRKIMKMDEERIRSINQTISNVLSSK